MIQIILVFGQTFAIILGFAKQLFLIGWFII